MTLSGADAGNYTVAASGTTTADITPLTLSITYAGVDRVYDGTNSAAVIATPTNRVSGDNLTIAVGSASFNDTVATIGLRGKDVGSAKTVDYSNVSLSGSDAGNYSLAATSGATTAAITAKALTVTGITASNKVYDASQAATVSVSGANNAAVLQAGGLVAGDQLVVSATGLFDTKHVGVGKTVTLTSTYSGNDRNNYMIAGQATTTADVTPKTLAITDGISWADKVYDGQTDAGASVATGVTNTILVNGGMVSGDVVTVTATGSYANKNVAYSTSVASGTISSTQDSTTLSITSGSINTQAAVGSIVRFYAGANGTGTLLGSSTLSAIASG
ncbi:MAG: hypothetical protein EBT58_07905, partial [Betaproteobacteria bacterium]|nr:hypothetical protein [Betaproteobacteria bacterium]